MTQTKVYPIRLPCSLKDAVSKIAREEGVSINQFIATAVTEKLATLNSGAFFQERRSRANFEEFRRILQRSGGEPPREGDELTP